MKRFVNSMQRGFTLIELMVVLVIVTILLSIAIPAYEDQMRRSRRADAINGLESMVLRQEQWRANNPRYGTLAPVRSFEPVWANVQVWRLLWQKARATRRWPDKLPTSVSTRKEGHLRHRHESDIARCWQAMSIVPQPDADMLRLHRLLNHTQQLGRQRVQVCFVACGHSKLRQHLLGVVFPAKEAPVDPVL